MNPVLSIAQKELKDGLRNRWIVAITLIFALLAIGISWFGAAASGVIGFTSIPNTIISLASLAVFLIPLISLLLAYDAIVGEDEDGTLLLLLTYPLTKGQLLIGKLLGHASILGISTTIGFGAAAIIISIFASNVDLVGLYKAFGLFIVSATLLGVCFVAIAYIISGLVTEKSKAAGMALISWFMFVLVFDLALLGILVATEGKFNAELFPYLLLLNPTDVFRLINLVGFDAVGTGLITIAADVNFSIYTLLLALVGWVLVPIGIAYGVFIKRKL
ncbi:MAG: ABC transporter permease subunit [Hahellaceae bacterium]|jgi:Cu-processing system permease protein|nr:ABC transporter permease subunit [Hahellaceae bacterium]MCP5213096.1 ABC transporter permease subunit [Hahellaceae bacterium]